MGKHIKFDHVNTHGDFTALMNHFGINYEKRGPQLRALCPFHEDSNPSLSITLEAQGEAKENTWHCFGCKESGSIIDFAARMTGGTLREGAELVAQISSCGLAPSRATKPRKAKTPRSAAKPSQPRGTPPPAEKSRERAPVASETASLTNPPLKFTLPLEHDHPYIAERVPPGLALRFGLGVCLENSRSMMAGRCCVPIHNADGDLIAYAGRYLGTDPGQPKWLMPKGFEKAQVLFNAHRVAGAGSVVLVEGFFDAIRLHGLGIPAVALMGTAISAAQVALLREIGVRRAVVLMDSDAEGRAVVADLVAALAEAVFVRAVTLPEGTDPASVEEHVLLDMLAHLNL